MTREQRLETALKAIWGWLCADILTMSDEERLKALEGVHKKLVRLGVVPKPYEPK